MLLWNLVLWSVLGSLPEAATERFRYFTHFGDTILSQSECIALGRIESVKTIRGGDIVGVDVLQNFKGDETEHVTLLAGRGEFFIGSEQLLFLAPYGTGGTWRFINRISRTDSDFDAKEECLQEHLELENISDEEDRKNAVRRLLFEGAQSAEEWTRWNMLRELRYILGQYEDLLGEDDIKGLRKIGEKSPDQEFREQLLKLLENR